MHGWVCALCIVRCRANCQLSQPTRHTRTAKSTYLNSLESYTVLPSSLSTVHQ
jgi:hypothetical protein